eukprot:6479859-Amphidinium_carterae.1
MPLLAETCRAAARDRLAKPRASPAFALTLPEPQRATSIEPSMAVHDRASNGFVTLVTHHQDDKLASGVPS